MLFSSTTFLFLFLPVLLIFYYLPIFTKHRSIRNILLLLFSLFFYAWGEPVYVMLMIFSICVTYIIGRGIGKHYNSSKGKIFLTIGAIYHLCILFIFKYLTFITGELVKLFHTESLNVNLALPIGISFFTFQMLSYLFDVYYGSFKYQKNIFDLALYVTFFPQLIAGPIVRYETVEYEIRNRRENFTDFSEGLKRFMVGLAKKALLADYLAIIADSIFSLVSHEDISMLTAWIGAIAYMLEIYFDFSGYSEMAIGLGRMFGFHFKENFNAPYTADSINDFWKRWHISLTDWFRDYVYIPLGGNRRGTRRQIINIIIVWVLTGIWHGANWTFLLWGGVYCAFQLLEKFCFSVDKWHKWIRHLYTLLIVCLCWVIFKSDSIALAGKYFAGMLGLNSIADDSGIMYLGNSWRIILVGVFFCLPWQEWLWNPIGSLSAEKKLNVVVEIIKYIIFALILLMASIISISGGYSPFIYFNF